MNVFQIQDDWSMDQLTLAERSIPEPGQGEVLLEMKAASLNYRDLLVPQRGYGALTGTLPLIPGSDGVDLIIEVGGQKTLPQSLRAIRAGGTISLIGVLSGSTMDVSLGQIVTRKVRLQGISVGDRDGMEAMTRAVSQHGMQPVIDRIFAFEALMDALHYLASGTHFGKICIRH